MSQPRDDIVPGSADTPERITGVMRRRRGMLLLVHRSGAHRLSFPGPEAVVELLVGQELVWEVNGRTDDGSLRAVPVMTGVLLDRVRKTLSRLTEQPPPARAPRRPSGNAKRYAFDASHECGLQQGAWYRSPDKVGKTNKKGKSGAPKHKSVWTASGGAPGCGKKR